MSATTRFTAPTLPEPPALYLALELSSRSWKLASSTGYGQKLRFRNVAARAQRSPDPSRPASQRSPPGPG